MVTYVRVSRRFAENGADRRVKESASQRSALTSELTQTRPESLSVCGHSSLNFYFFAAHLPMPSFEPWHVFIHDAETDTKLEEYNVVTTGKKTECWVESKEGSQFTVNMLLSPHAVRISEAISCHLFLDGQRASKRLLGAYDPEKIRTEAVVRDVQLGQGIVKPFKFAKIRFLGMNSKSLVFLMCRRGLSSQQERS